jgi:hypothetical protein
MKTANARRETMKALRARMSGAGAVLAMALVSGCASYPVPALQLAASHAAIDSASASPGMGSELALAREKMAVAAQLGASGSYQEMRWLAEQAEVDAELAHVRGLTARATIMLAAGRAR